MEPSLRAVNVAAHGGGVVDEQLRDSVLRRSSYRCEVGSEECTRLATEVHHRKPRGRGGFDTYENLVATCANCHTQSRAAIHRNPAWATEVGLLVPSWEPTPAGVWCNPGSGLGAAPSFPGVTVRHPTPSDCTPTGERIVVIGGPWPERWGCAGQIVNPPAAGNYPQAVRGEVLILLDDDPLGSSRFWTCAISVHDVRQETP